MTLRVTFDIVPFGQEIEKYSIGQVDISNINRIGFDLYDYKCTFTLLEKGVQKPTIEEYFIEHSRKDGFIKLVKKAIDAYLERKSNG